MLSCGIVGLPNAGKSTLFNALASRRLAETAPRPFTTIEPHEAVVAVYDDHFHRLCDLVNPEKAVPASVTFIDIAGLVKGAHQGEGLGNQFLAKIREVNAIVHVVRAFRDERVPQVHGFRETGTMAQFSEDIEVVNLELELGGIKDMPTIIVLNVDEEGLGEKELVDQLENKFRTKVIMVVAKLEEEMIDLDSGEKKEMFKLLDWERSALDTVIQEAYRLLGLITFYTIKGGREAHAWAVSRGSKAIEAAAVVHSDFGKNFIKAEVIEVGKLLEAGGWKSAKEKGMMRLEGRDYLISDRDVIEFKVGG